MGPNNGENQSVGVETPQTTTNVAVEGDGLIPNPGASAQETNVQTPMSGETTSFPAAESTTTPSTPELTTPTTTNEASSSALNPLSPLGTPDMSSLKATYNTMVAEKAAAQAAPQKPGLGNRLLGLIGLRGGAKTESVETPKNTIPEHLKDGVTPPVPNVTPEAAAAVNQEPVKPSTTDLPTESSTETSTNSSSDKLTQMGDGTTTTAEVNTTPSTDTKTENTEAIGTNATSTVAETNSAVNNTTETNTELNSPIEAKPTEENTNSSTSITSQSSSLSGYDSQVNTEKDAVTTNANAFSDTTPTTASTSSPDASSSWPTGAASEPTLGPSTAEAQSTNTPSVPEYQPSADITPASEAVGPTTPMNWSIDASATQPEAPLVESVSPTPDQTSVIPSPEPNSLNIERTPTPLKDSPTETPSPFEIGPQTNSNDEYTTQKVVSQVETGSDSPTVSNSQTAPLVETQQSITSPTLGGETPAQPQPSVEPTSTTLPTNAAMGELNTTTNQAVEENLEQTLETTQPETSQASLPGGLGEVTDTKVEQEDGNATNTPSLATS